MVNETWVASLAWTDSREQRFLDDIETALRLFNSITSLDSRVSALMSIYELVTQCKRPTGNTHDTHPLPQPSFPNAQICRIWHSTAQNYMMNRNHLYRYLYNPPGIPGVPHTDPAQLHALDTHFFAPFIVSTNNPFAH